MPKMQPQDDYPAVPVALKCALCLHASYHSDSENGDAVTIINGQAVCLGHAGYVQGDGFSRALALVKNEERDTDDDT